MHPWRRIALLTVLLTGAAIHPLQAADGLSIIPGRWEFGTIPDTEAIHLEVTVRNQGEESVRITFIPTCDCLFVEPGRA